MHKLFIHELKVETLIGCLPWEQQVKQPVILDLIIEHNHRSLDRLDELQDTIDYVAITDAVTSFVSTHTFKLLETLAEKTATFILDKFKISKINLSVTKLAAIRNAKSVSVTIESLGDMYGHP